MSHVLRVTSHKHRAMSHTYTQPHIHLITSNISTHTSHHQQLDEMYATCALPNPRLKMSHVAHRTSHLIDATSHVTDRVRHTHISSTATCAMPNPRLKMGHVTHMTSHVAVIRSHVTHTTSCMYAYVHIQRVTYICHHQQLAQRRTRGFR